jgi:hypothetical protein
MNRPMKPSSVASVSDGAGGHATCSFSGRGHKTATDASNSRGIFTHSLVISGGVRMVRTCVANCPAESVKPVPG